MVDSSFLRTTGFETRQASYDLLVAKVEGGKSLSPSEITSMSRFEKELAAAGIDLPKYLDTPEQVAEYSGYKVRTIYNAVKKGDLVRLSDSRFLREEVDQWLLKKGKRPVVPVACGSENDGEESSESTGFNARTEEARYRHFRARREELIVKQMEKELIDRDAMNQAFVARVYEFKTAILLYSRRVAHKVAEVAGVESHLVVEVMDKEGKDMLKALSRKVDIHVD